MTADLVLETGVVVVFAALAGLAAWAFSRRVIARLGVGWRVGMLIPAVAAGIAISTLWGADLVFLWLDPPQLTAQPDSTGSAALDVTLFLAFVAGQAGAGLQHMGATVAAMIGSTLVWLVVTGSAALRVWRVDATKRRYLEGKG